MVTDLAPDEAEAKEDEGGDRRLETDELGHESFGAVQFLLEFAGAEVWGPKAAPRRGKFCRVEPSILSGARASG